MGSIWTLNQHLRPVPASITAAILAALIIVSPITAARVGAPSLCGAAETLLFTCPVGKKIVSICGADGKATYKFGTPARIEMSSQSLFTANHAFSGGGETQISFNNENYTYTVFDKTIRTSLAPNGQNDPDFTSGLVVQKNGRTISSTACGADATISASATHLIPSGQYIEH